MSATNNNLLPQHVSIIMDGNGRWAKQRGKERTEGHIEGVESVRACTEYAAERGIKYLSLFAFSEENWGRPQEEVEALMSLMVKCISAETPTFTKNNIRFVVLGNLERLSEGLRTEIADCMALTAGNTGLTLILFLSYSGKWDIVQAANTVLASNGGEGEITMEQLEAALCTRAAAIPDPDLLIRTSGEMRISNYMLWQSAYTEYYFTDILWPDFRKNEFKAALDEYAKRERRYGKV